MSKRFLLLLIAAISIRLLWIALLPVTESRLYNFIDADGYLNAVEAFHSGDFLDNGEQIKRMPLYPSLVSYFVRSLSCGSISTDCLGPMLFIRLWHLLLDVCTLSCIYFFVRKQFNESAALLSTSLYAIYPLALYRLPVMNAELIQGAAIAFWLLGASRLLETGKTAHAILLSILSAVLVFISPALQLIPFCFFILLFFWRPPKNALRLGAALLIPFMIFCIGWGLRNYAVAGEFFLFDIRGGKEFWLGNNQAVDGRWEGSKQKIWLGQWSQYMNEAKQRGGGDKEINQYLYKKGLEEIRSNPAGAFVLFAKKFYRFWYVPASEQMTLVLFPIQSFYLILALAGLFATGIRSPRSALPLFIIAYFCGIYTLSYACIRFSLPVMPWICALGGVGLTHGGFKKWSAPNEGFEE